VTPVLRPYQPRDRAALVSLWSRCGLTRPWNDPYRDIDRKLTRDAPNLLVLEDGDKLVGSVMVGYEGHRGWVNYLAVHPGHQRRGLGRVLMDEAERRLRELGCAKVNLQIRTSNEAAVEFYRHIGYTVDDVVSMGRRLEDDGARPDPAGGLS
jgi:ribosomal protein S18 acetylase RimI-like enzyme